MPFYLRKPTRIPGYDYSSQNYYFVTICTHNKACIFGKPGKPNILGKIAEECIQKIPEFYPQIQIDQSVVMPNHVHAIVIVGANIKAEMPPNLSHIIGQYKMAVTKKVHHYYPNLQVWQRSFHDHIIRNQHSYEKIWEYIKNNPIKWDEDCFYTEQQEENF